MVSNHTVSMFELNQYYITKSEPMNVLGTPLHLALYEAKMFEQLAIQMHDIEFSIKRIASKNMSIQELEHNTIMDKNIIGEDRASAV